MRMVLVGDDGSPAAARAVEWATRFGGERDAKVIALHVSADGDEPVGAQEVERITVRDRHPAAALMETAAELDADLIVLGRRGRGGFPSLPIGTTAHHVAGASGRPVVVVPVDDAPADTPLVQRVVVGLDGLPGSDEAVRWAARNFEDAHFTAVHALELAPSLAAPDEVERCTNVRGNARPN